MPSTRRVACRSPGLSTRLGSSTTISATILKTPTRSSNCVTRGCRCTNGSITTRLVSKVQYREHVLLINMENTAKAIEFMIVDALRLAEPVMNIARRLEDPKKYLYLTDRIQGEIEASEDPVCDTFCTIQLFLISMILTETQRSTGDSASYSRPRLVQARRLQGFCLGSEGGVEGAVHPRIGSQGIQCQICRRSCSAQPRGGCAREGVQPQSCHYRRDRASPWYEEREPLGLHEVLFQAPSRPYVSRILCERDRH